MRWEQNEEANIENIEFPKSWFKCLCPYLSVYVLPKHFEAFGYGANIDMYIQRKQEECYWNLKPEDIGQG